MSFFKSTTNQDKEAGIISLNSNFELIDVNEQFLSMIQFEKDEILGLTIDEIDSNTAIQIKKQYTVSSFGHLYTLLTKKDKTYASVEICFFTQSLNNIESTVLIIKDVSDADVITSKCSIIEQIFNHSNEGIAVTDVEGYIHTVNKSFTKLMGLRKLKLSVKPLQF